MRKYRWPVLTPTIDARLKQVISQFCSERQKDFLEMEIMPDHVHLLVKCDPQFGINRLIGSIKGRSSRAYLWRRRHSTGTVRSVQRIFSLLLHSKYPGHPPSASGLANCGTAVETGDVGKKPIRERESTLLSPGYSPQSGSSVEEGHCPVRGCGCCSASESRGEYRPRAFRIPWIYPWGGSGITRYSVASAELFRGGSEGLDPKRPEKLEGCGTSA